LANQTQNPLRILHWLKIEEMMNFA